MEETFVDNVRKGKIKSPVQVGFSLNSWDKEWKRLNSADEKSRNVYISGKIIDSILVEIRDELKKLYDKAPKVSNEKLLMIYFAFFSNYLRKHNS